MGGWKDGDDAESMYEEIKKSMGKVSPFLLFELEAVNMLYVAAFTAFPSDHAYKVIGGVTRLVNSFDDPLRRALSYMYLMLPIVPEDSMDSWNLDDRERASLAIIKKSSTASIANMVEFLKEDPELQEVITKATEFALRDLTDAFMTQPFSISQMSSFTALKVQYDALLQRGPSVPSVIPDAPIPVVDEDHLDGDENPEGLNFEPNI